MYKRLLALRNKLSTWRSQSDGFSWKIMPSNFNQRFCSIPCTRRGSGLEILACTTISQVLVRFSFIRFLTAQCWMLLTSMREWSWCVDTGALSAIDCAPHDRSYVVYHNREQYGPEDSTLRYPSVDASKLGDKAVHDYSLFPITKKADNPIVNIAINVEWH